MIAGLIELIKSRRFQLLVVAGVAWVLQQDSITSQTVLQAVSGILVGAVGVGTLDRASTKIGGNK